MTQDHKFTQQEWDKVVGWGKVPQERELKPESKNKPEEK